MKLHGYHRSSTSYRLRIALELKGLAFESASVNLLADEQREESFRKRNPFGGVPMLQADGRDRAQSMAILEWLNEAHPANPLLPTDIEDRFTCRELAYAIATELHAPLNLPVLRYLKQDLAQEQETINTWYHHWLARTLTPLEQRLEQMGTSDYLFDAPGLFEAVLIPQLYNARRFRFDLRAMPRMRQIESACVALDAFEKAHPGNQPDAQ